MSKKKKTFRKRKEKIGDFLIDISKYIVTVFLFSAVFKDVSKWGVTEYSLTALGVLAILIVAFMLQEDEQNNNSKKK